MQFGLHSVNLHTCGDSETARHVASAAEAAGFESLWVADHVVLPEPPLPDRPMLATQSGIVRHERPAELAPSTVPSSRTRVPTQVRTIASKRVSV